MNTASNLHDTISSMREYAQELYPEKCTSWASKLITQTGELLLADALRKYLTVLKVSPNSGEAYTFSFEANLCNTNLSDNEDVQFVPICFHLILPCGNGMTFNPGVELGFSLEGDLYCRVDPNRCKTHDIPENISNWKL
jgi:hypothetical protein